MAEVERVFFDTSVLLAGLVESLGPEAPDAQEILGAIAEKRLKEPLTAWHCCLEFYSVSTRLPEEFRLTPEAALTLLKQEILQRFAVHDLPANRREGFLESAGYDRVVGGRVYDLHIAEVARAAKATVVLTGNRRHFSSLLRHGITVLDCREFASRLRAKPRRGPR